MNHKKQLPQTEKTLGRRELLKALAATGGAITAATMLPGKWAKPVVEAGVLPAHAQSSAIVLRNLLVNLNPLPPGSNSTPGVQAAGITATVDYTDGLGGIDDNSELSWTTEYTAPQLDAADVGALASRSYTKKLGDLIEWGPDGFSGTITFPIFGEDFVQIECDSTVKVTAHYLKTSDGRMSNGTSGESEYNCI